MRAADSFRIFCGVLSVLKSMHSRGVTVRRVRPSMLRITASGVSASFNISYHAYSFLLLSDAVLVLLTQCCHAAWQLPSGSLYHQS